MSVKEFCNVQNIKTIYNLLNRILHQLINFVYDLFLWENVQVVLWPVYEATSSDDLYQQCIGRNRQNSNESLNTCVWKFTPKHLHFASKTVEIAIYLAVNIVNEGYSILKLKTSQESLLVFKVKRLLEILIDINRISTNRKKKRSNAAKCALWTGGANDLWAKNRWSKLVTKYCN